jgi:hypothetical protein
MERVKTMKLWLCREALRCTSRKFLAKLIGLVQCGFRLGKAPHLVF